MVLEVIERLMNYTYILKCADGSFYTGWTNNLEKRLAAHNNGTGSKYTSSHRPVELVYFEEHETRHDAMSREVQIKKLTRKQKETLVQEACQEKLHEVT